MLGRKKIEKPKMFCLTYHRAEWKINPVPNLSLANRLQIMKTGKLILVLGIAVLCPVVAGQDGEKETPPPAGFKTQERHEPQKKKLFHRVLQGDFSNFTFVAISGDSKTIAYGMRAPDPKAAKEEIRVILCAARTGKEIRRLPISKYPDNGLFSPALLKCHGPLLVNEVLARFALNEDASRHKAAEST